MKKTNRNYTNLTVNPCKMCMPLGAVTAFYGVKGCMSIIHGSQGCSTYIRRHMATHYNEPIDIASSALTEQGTVYGGEENLLKGIKNLTKLYQPKVIGICTTCLAETIGEDVPRIIQKAKEQGIAPDVTFVNVPSPGYGGSQFEGFLAATRAIVMTLATDTTPNQSVNIIASYMSPAEMRELKDILDAFALDYTLLPDISENLDRVYDPVYNRLPQDGTDLADIRRMAGARFTIEIGEFSSAKNSAAQYLHEQFGIPFKKVPLPIGLRGTDALLQALSEVSGKPIPMRFQKARGRYLDAMVDAHKYTGEARVVVFGEPDLVYGLTRLCLEVGALPMLVATGSKNESFKGALEGEIEQLAKVKMSDYHEILDDTDFDKIAGLAVEHSINLMIGNSDGRRVQEKTGIELLRVGFPMHDRVGGQRQVCIGYEGSLQVMDGIANAMIHATATTFRKAMYDMYYTGSDKKQEVAPQAHTVSAPQAMISLSREEVKAKTKKHPCYDCSACSSGNARMHLPVAPACNIQCNYCSRDFDCPNESRPGVTSGVLNPEEAVAKYLKVKEKVPNLSVVGIAGPGDVLANFEQVKATLAGIRKVDPDVTFCVSTNGLMLPFYANELLQLGVSHLTVTLNAVDENIGAKIYKHVNYLGKRYTGVEGARILRDNQLSGIRYLVSKGMVIKINIVMLKGINDDHIETVVQTVRDLDCEITNIMQMIPVKGSAFEGMDLVSNKELMEKRKACSTIMKQMYHCKQCRADAIGTLDNDISIQFREKEAAQEQKEEPKRLRFAVASKSGMIVDTHFGHAVEFHIYDYQGGSVMYVERRAVSKYCKGADDCGDEGPGIDNIMETIRDCQGVICMRIGAEPSKKLRGMGIEPFMMYDRVESGVKEAAEKILSGEAACNTAAAAGVVK